MRKAKFCQSFVSDDPRVYEPVFYEILVAKEYYAHHLCTKIEGIIKQNIKSYGNPVF